MKYASEMVDEETRLEERKRKAEFAPKAVPKGKGKPVNEETGHVGEKLKAGEKKN